MGDFAARVAAHQLAASDSSTQVFAHGLGSTPAAAILCGNYATAANGSDSADEGLSFGVFKGTSGAYGQKSVYYNGEDGQSTMDYHTGIADNALKIADPGGTGHAANMDPAGTALNATNLRINDANAAGPTGAYRFLSLALGGSACQVDIQQVTTTAGGETTITHNFDTTNHHLYIVLTAHDGDQNRWRQSIGFGHWDGSAGTITQRQAWRYIELGSTCIIDGSVNTDIIAGAGTGALPGVLWEATTPTKDSLILDNSTGSSAREVLVVSIDLGSSRGKVGHLTSPGSSGTWSITDCGFQPLMFSLLMTEFAAVDTEYEDTGNGEGWSWGFFDGVNQACLSGVSQKGASPSVCKSAFDSARMVHVKKSASGTTSEHVRADSSSAPSFTRTGLNIPLDTSAAEVGIYFAIEDQDAYVPTAGAVALQGQSVALRLDVRRAPGAGAFSFSGTQPSVSTPWTPAPGAGALSLSGQSVGLALDVRRTPAVGAFSFSGAQPAVAEWLINAPTVGTVALAGQAATLVSKIRYAPTSGAFVLQGQSVTLARGFILDPNESVLGFQGQSVALKETPTLTLQVTQALIDQLPDEIPVDWPRASEHRIVIADTVNKILQLLKAGTS